MANDVAKALGYKVPKDAVTAHCKGAIKHRYLTNGGYQELKMIPEGDIYRLAARSKLPSAEEFESWVFDEVLPQIRQTGGYIPINDNETNEEFLARAFVIATETLKKKDEIIALKDKQLDEQRPLVDFATKVSNTSDLIDMGRMAKLLKDEHIDIGRNRLFEWLRQNEILMKNNTPYQRYVDSEYFKIRESISETPYGTKTYITTYVTGKGQIYLTEKLRKEFGQKVS